MTTPSTGMRRIALLVEYEGTAFAGSQAQPAQRTVQQVIEAALEQFTQEPQRVRFAGRTDAGVHARGQVVTLDTRTRHAASRFRDALNRYLPDDVSVRAACETAADFDPRRAAIARRYVYVIEDGRPRSPLSRLRAWQLETPLDSAAMANAAATLPREPRDWSAFAGSLAAGRSPVRTLQRCTVVRCEPHRLLVTIEAESFLPQQVRRVVGALTRVGSGSLPDDGFARLIDGPAGSAGPAAPPLGLTLEAVRYPRGMVEWDDDEDLPAA